MPYLIDGHNLIPKLPGISLSAIDDEITLVVLLQEYYRRSRKRVEVYFDNAPPGQAGIRKYGMVVAYFVPQGQTVDDAIRIHLGKLGRNARNWIVVSSDHQVQMDARAAHARVIPSERFARELLGGTGSSIRAEKPADVELSPDEVTAWMNIFSKR